MVFILSKFEWPFTQVLLSRYLIVSGVLYFVNSTVNPILYNAMSKKYRRAFVRTIFPCKVRDTGTSLASVSPGSKSSPYTYNKLYLRQHTHVTIVNDEEAISSPV